MTHECDAVLAVKTVKSDVTLYKQDLSWMKLVNEQNYDEAKKNLKVDVPGYFDGSWSDFETKRNLLNTQEWFQRSENMVRTQYLSLTPDAAIPAWRDCMVGANHGAVLIGYLRELNDANAVLNLEWSPPQGTVGTLRRTRLNIIGATVVKGSDDFSTSVPVNAPPDKGFSGTARVLLKREASNSNITVTASGRVAGGFVYSVSLDYSPPLPPPPVKLFYDRKNCGPDSGSYDVEAVDHDRTLQIYVLYESNFEEWGNPTFGLTVRVDGVQQFTRTDGSQRSIGNGYDTIDTLFQRRLKAGQSMRISADITSFRSKAHAVIIEVKELAP